MSKKKSGLTVLWGLVVLMSLATMVAQAAEPDFGGVTPFRYRWLEQDYLVGSPGVTRPFTWGPNIPALPSVITEPYDSSPGGTRQVLYLDKARMEINNPANNFVTSGLAAKELVSGLRQDGDNTFKTLQPSQTQVAGDPVAVNPTSPVYASFKNLVTLGNADATSKPVAPGAIINAFINKNGLVSNFAPPQTLVNGPYDSIKGHNIAQVFWDFMTQNGPTTNPANLATIPNAPVYTPQPISNVFGLPLAEPMWVTTKIAGVDRTVLVQIFERRVLTYNPAIQGASKVEMGNVGQHYYQWRYVESQNSLANFDGTWYTNFAILNLNQNNTDVSGFFTSYGMAPVSFTSGKVNGNTLNLTWGSGITAKSGKFTLSADGNSLTGTWKANIILDTHPWCGVRNGPLPDGCGWSGKWNMQIANNQPTVANLVQTASNVNGTVFTTSHIDGTMIGNDLSGKWSSSKNLVFSYDFKAQYVDYDMDQFYGYVKIGNSKEAWCGWRDGSTKPNPCQKDNV